MGIRIEATVATNSTATFKEFMDELNLAFHKLGLEFDPKVGGSIREGDEEVGRVILWNRGKETTFLLNPASWKSQAKAEISFKFQTTTRGTKVVIDYEGIEGLLESKGEKLGWFADQIVTPAVSSLVPTHFGDWITDRWARRPVGSAARRTYRNPIHHYPNFRVILEELRLTPDDYLLEIGCGGGAFLNDALKSGCKAAAVDHSPEMVRLTRRVNDRAVKEGRLEVRESEADSLPFKDSIFTCAVMTSVLGFLPDAVKVFSEIRRVLAPGGRMVVTATSKESRGTIATPEPVASRVHFYEDRELEQMALDAGFLKAHADRPDLSRFAKEVGIPKSHVSSFSIRIGQLLIGTKGQ